MVHSAIDKKYFYYSLAIHLVALILFPIIERFSSNITNSFVVYGAYSKKPTQAFFKLPKSTSSMAAKRVASKQKAAPKKPVVTPSRSKRSKAAPPISVPKMKKEIKPAAPKSEKDTAQKVSPATEKEVKASKKTSSKQFEKVDESAKKPEKEENEQGLNKEAKDSAQEEKSSDILDELENEEGVIDFDNVSSDIAGNQKFLLYQKHIQQEVARLWKPPLGVAKGAECTLLFTINDKGAVASFEITKPSKIIIYDLSIRKIAKKFSFEQSLWGKKFTVTFRQ